MGRVAAVIQQPNELGQFARAFVPMMSKQIDDSRRTKSLQEAYAEMARQGEMIKSSYGTPNSTPSGANNPDWQLLGSKQPYDPRGSFVQSILPAMLPFWFGGGVSNVRP